MTTFPINIYNPLCILPERLLSFNKKINTFNPLYSLPERHQQFYLTTWKVIKATQPIFILLTPKIAGSIFIAQKSWDLKTKVCKFSRQYFSSNKKNTQKRRLKISTKIKPPSYQKKKRRSKNLVKNNLCIWAHLRDISLPGIAIHTTLYNTFPGKIIRNLEETVPKLTQISSIYSAGKYEIITQEMLTLTKNIFFLVVILSGYKQILLPAYLLGTLAALLKAYIEKNNEQYLAAYTQVLWILFYLVQLNDSYEKYFKKILDNQKII